jgi:hypothetical protein
MNRIIIAILFAICLTATLALMSMDTKGQNIGICIGLAAIATTITGGNLVRKTC